MFIIKTEADKIRAINYISSMPLHPVQYVDIDRYVKSRTKAQNRAFHKWVSIISDYTGYALEEVKDKLVLSLWEPVTRKVKARRDGAWVEFELSDRRSTTDLNTAEMSELIMATQAVAKELGLSLPMPDDFLDSY